MLEKQTGVLFYVKGAARRRLSTDGLQVPWRKQYDSLSRVRYLDKRKVRRQQG